MSRRRARLVRSVGLPIQVGSDGEAARAIAVAIPDGFGVIALRTTLRSTIEHLGADGRRHYMA